MTCNPVTLWHLVTWYFLILYSYIVSPEKKRKINNNLAVLLSYDNDSILAVCDRMTKIAHFVPTMEKTSAEGVVRLFWNNVWKLHGLPESIIIDRRAQFAARMMKELNQMLGIDTKLSTAYHPQTDGQTERINQDLEQYLRIFINHWQEQWPD